jgi:hypothetical protein
MNIHKMLFNVIIAACFSSLNGATFTVINVNDTGNGSLRWALTQANTNPGFDIIDFNISGTGVQTILPLSQLPPLIDTAGVFIDGLTQTGASPGPNPPSTCTLMVEVNGINAGAAHGFWILSPNNTIQGLVVNNFQQHGIRIQGTPTGTYNNVIAFNYVGVNPAGNMAQSNGWNHNRFWGGIYIEVVLDSIGLAFDNTIDANLTSTNHVEGVGISSCPPGDVYQNYVINNYIGTDYTGTVDLGNLHDGVYIGEGAHDNLVDGNLISGNDFEGVCIIGYPPYGWNSHSNTIIHNIIGLDINLAPLANSMDGVSIGQYGNVYQGGYATDNLIDNNTIAHNLHNGVTVWEYGSNNTNADYNRITQNSIYNNNQLGIDLGDDNVTLNDINDPDTGPNEEVNFPVITSASYHAGQTTITGTIDIDTDPTQAIVEIFQANPDPSGYGEGMTYLNSTTPDATGNWNIVVTGLNVNDDVTSTTTDLVFNTSEFGHNFTVVSGIEENDITSKPDEYMLEQNMPNPFSKLTKITFAVPKTTHVNLSIYDVSGKHVITLVNKKCAPAYYTTYWDGRDEDVKDVSAGVYFYRLKSENFTATNKLILTR